MNNENNNKPNSKKVFAIIAIALVLVIALIAAVIVLTKKLVDKDSYRVVKVETYEGDVSLMRDDYTMDVFEDMNLIPDDNVETKAASEILLLVDDDKHILASENTIFEIAASGTPESGKVKVELKYGEALFTIDNKLSDDDTFKVTTPNAAMSVRGTEFLVRYDIIGEYTYVEVHNGVVEVKSDTETLMLEEGDSVYIYDDHIELASLDADQLDDLYKLIEDFEDSYQSFYADYSDTIALITDDIILSDIERLDTLAASLPSSADRPDVTDDDEIADLIDELNGYVSEIEWGLQYIDDFRNNPPEVASSNAADMYAEILNDPETFLADNGYNFVTNTPETYGFYDFTGDGTDDLIMTFMSKEARTDVTDVATYTSVFISCDTGSEVVVGEISSHSPEIVLLSGAYIEGKGYDQHLGYNYWFSAGFYLGFVDADASGVSASEDSFDPANGLPTYDKESLKQDMD